MAEQPNVVAGGPIEASWGNTIRDRTVQRYADTAERTSENPSPTAGDLAFMVDRSTVEAFNAAGWLGVVPAGAIVMYGGAAAPAGWLLCQGQSISRTTYATLFAVFGTAYGSASGSTFNLPNLQQRFPLGKAASGTGATLGDTGGAINHTHTNPTTGSAGSHSHSVATHTHTNNTPVFATSGGGLAFGQEGSGSTFQYATASHQHAQPSTDGSGPLTTSSATHHSHTQSATGGNNPPYVVVNFMVKL